MHGRQCTQYIFVSVLIVLSDEYKCYEQDYSKGQVVKVTLSLVYWIQVAYCNKTQRRTQLQLIIKERAPWITKSLPMQCKKALSYYFLNNK